MLERTELEQRLQSCIGVAAGPQHSWDAVNLPMIRHWCDAMGDDCPRYTDINAAAVYGGISAPATMIQAWTMSGFRGRAAPGSQGLPEGVDNHYDLLTEAGFVSVVAVNCDQRYFQPVRLGDEVYHRKSLESVSGHKRTALGEGYFTTELWRFYNQRDEHLADMRFRLLRFVPSEGSMAMPDSAAAVSPIAEPAPVAMPYRGGVVAEGSILPALDIEVSTGLIVATALASRDYQNVHHDRDQAQTLGSKDIFMNILTSNGLVGRLVTDWCGAAGELKQVDIRLGVPNYAGDSMRLSGTVKSVSRGDGEQIVEIDVVGVNSIGPHVTGAVAVTLPI